MVGFAFSGFSMLYGILVGLLYFGRNRDDTKGDLTYQFVTAAFLRRSSAARASIIGDSKSRSPLEARRVMGICSDRNARPLLLHRRAWAPMLPAMFILHS
jgi:hypothetical protein